MGDLFPPGCGPACHTSPAGDRDFESEATDMGDEKLTLIDALYFATVRPELSPWHDAQLMSPLSRGGNVSAGVSELFRRLTRRFRPPRPVAYFAPLPASGLEPNPARTL